LATRPISKRWLASVQGPTGLRVTQLFLSSAPRLGARPATAFRKQAVRPIVCRRPTVQAQQLGGCRPLGQSATGRSNHFFLRPPQPSRAPPGAFSLRQWVRYTRPAVLCGGPGRGGDRADSRRDQAGQGGGPTSADIVGPWPPLPKQAQPDGCLHGIDPRAPADPLGADPLTDARRAAPGGQFRLLRSTTACPPVGMGLPELVKATRGPGRHLQYLRSDRRQGRRRSAHSACRSHKALFARSAAALLKLGPWVHGEGSKMRALGIGVAIQLRGDRPRHHCLLECVG